MRSLAREDGSKAQIIFLIFASIFIGGFVWLLLQEGKQKMVMNQRKEAKTLTEYRFLLERESLAEMGNQQRARLELAAWDLSKTRNQFGAYSAFNTKVQTSTEKYNGQWAMKVNYPRLSYDQCVALSEVAVEVQQPYAVSGQGCSEAHTENWVAIYFPEQKPGDLG